MATEPHQQLRSYILAIRGLVARNDAFGQYLIKLVYRESRVGAGGLFRRVRAVADAVSAAGGTLIDARAWTAQAIRWWRTGQAIEQKYARFEVDPSAFGAMEALIRFLQSLPDDLLQAHAVGKSLFLGRSLRGALGSPKPDDPPAQPANPVPATPGSRFGGSPPPGAASPTQPARPSGSLGARLSANPPANPFGSALASSPPQNPLSRLFGRPSPDVLPFHVAACFDALAVLPRPANSAATPEVEPDDELPDWLRPFGVGEAPHAPDAPAEPGEPLPADFRGLVERLHQAADTGKDVAPVLRELGKFDDMRLVEHVYKLRREGDDVSRLFEMFQTLDGNVGVAGLISLLPIDSRRREAWLTALCAVTREAARSAHPLSDESIYAVWKIAVAESVPNIAFCPAAFHLLAATRRSEAFHILWEHANTEDQDRRRIALYAIAEGDPGERLEELLTAMSDLSDNLTPPLNPPPPLPFGPRTPPEPQLVGIPFERLEAVVCDSKSKKAKQAKLRACALHLLSYLDDPRVAPFLIAQLSRRVPRLREIALAHLRRLRAKTAADAIARLMLKDAALRQRAAATLYDWEDDRCVPVLLSIMLGATDVEPQHVVERLGKFSHPDFDTWLSKVVTGLNGKASESEETLVRLIDALLKPDNHAVHHARPVLEALIDSGSIRVRQAAICAFGQLDEAWAHEMLNTLVLNRLPAVSYRAAVLCKDKALGRQLIACPQELSRVLGVRLLWAANDSNALLGCLSDKSAAVRNLAIWALGDLGVAAAIDPLRRLVETEDRIDNWNQNPAVTAWGGLARMGALSGSAGAAAEPAA
jgi:HEAT repeat protein